MIKGIDVCWSHLKCLHEVHKEMNAKDTAQALWSAVITFTSVCFGIPNPTRSKRLSCGTRKLEDVFRDGMGITFMALEKMKRTYGLKDTTALTATTSYVLNRFQAEAYTVTTVVNLVRRLKEAGGMRGEGRRLVAAFGARVLGTHLMRGMDTVKVGEDEWTLGTWYNFRFGMGSCGVTAFRLIEEQNVLCGPGFEGPILQWVVDRIEAGNRRLDIGGVPWWEDHEFALRGKQSWMAERILHKANLTMTERAHRRANGPYPDGWTKDMVVLEIEEERNEMEEAYREQARCSLKVLRNALHKLGIRVDLSEVASKIN